MGRYKLFLTILFIFLVAFPGFGANITVPSLELISRGVMDGDLFVINTQGEMDMFIQAGDKFGGKIELGFKDEHLETDMISAAGLDGLSFKGASIVVRNLFSLPVSLSYFIGESVNFCYGNNFSDVFGAAPVITSYSGFLYFPTGIAYKGIYPANGTGIQLALQPVQNIFYSSLSFYQDTALGSGHYSYDLQFMFNFNTINLEVFAGGSFPVSQFGYYRAGILFNAQTPGGGFLMQLGVPRWDPYTDILELGLFYVLFEVNIHLGILSIIPSVFLHPGYYAQAATGEAGIIDFNMNLKLGDIQKNLVCGGLESNVSYNSTTKGLTAKVSPYLKLYTPGVEWQFKVNTTVFPTASIDQMFEGLVGIKAVF